MSRRRKLRGKLPEETPDLFETDLRTLAHVQRWGVARLIRSQSVAEHQFYVAVYSVQIADFLKWAGSYCDLVLWALAHDSDENISGDVMGHFKAAAVDKERADRFLSREIDIRYGSFIGELLLNGPATEEVRAIVKAADMVDEIAHLMMDQQLGNRGLHRVIHDNSIPRLHAAWMNLPADKAWLEQQFEEVVMPRVRAHREEPVRSFVAS